MSMSLSSSPSSSSLLTPTERHAFNAFLTQVDGGPDDLTLSSEWAMYSHLAPPHAEGTDALAKATKDLIALHPQPKFTTFAQQHRPIAPAPITASYLVPAVLRPSSSKHPPHSTSSLQQHSPSRPNLSKRSCTSPESAESDSSPISNLKSTLLSSQQKKANHIQSEQKRRANIRRGYEALCDTVPALREAIRADEEGCMSGGATSGRRKRSKVDDGEKIDGRAGPRSESVVLQKTIEHIQGLLEEKHTLLLRLERAHRVLGQGHPAVYSEAYSQGQALWERDWDGGKGLMMDIDGEHDTDDD